MLTVKDSVHDHVEVGDVAADLIETPAVQRLRRVRQLGTVSYVYPSANHTRFEHSLGVYHLATRALNHLELSGSAAKRVQAAALLHDVGHGPYSHNVEGVIHRETGRYHDEVDDLLARGAVGEVLRDHDLDPANVARLVDGEGRYGQLVSGELDVDRMDYLVRDAHHTGVPYGTIDTGRLIRELRFVDGELVLAEGNVQAAESLLLARALMNPTVYNHHAARVAKAMLRQGAERLLDAGVDPARLRRMDDPELRVRLRECDATAETARRLDERHLFKRAVWAEMDDVPADLLEADAARLRAVERAVADRADLPAWKVVVDVPPAPSMRESRTRVVVNGDIRRLDRQSPLVDALRASQRGQWRLGVYAPADATDRVGTAAVRELGLDIDGALVREVRTGLQGRLDDFEE